MQNINTIFNILLERYLLMRCSLQVDCIRAYLWETHKFLLPSRQAKYFGKQFNCCSSYLTLAMLDHVWLGQNVWQAGLNSN